MKLTLFRMCLAVVLMLLWVSAPVSADDFSFSTIPASGDISGPPGSTIGWGFSITNNSQDWLETTALNAGSFLELNALVSPNPNLLFDYPIVSPEATVKMDYLAGSSGLYEITWDLLATVGFVNSGDFVLSGELFSTDPTSVGAVDLGAAPDLMTPYTASVAAVPEPSTMILMLTACASVVAFLRRRVLTASVRELKGWRGAVTLFFALGALIGTGAEQAWGNSVNPFVNVSYDFSLETDDLFQGFSDSQTGVSSIANSYSLVDNPHIGPGPHRGASTQVGGTAQYGDLHTSTQVSAIGNPLGNPGLGKGIAIFSFNDILTAVDNRVSPRTPIQFEFNLTLDGSIAAFNEAVHRGKTTIATNAFSYTSGGFGAFVEAGSGLPSSLGLGETLCTEAGLKGGCGHNSKGYKVFPGGQLNDTGDIVLSGIITTTPGARIDIAGILTTESAAQGATDAYPCGKSTCFVDLSANASSDFADSAAFTVIPLTSGASYQSASGASYLGTSTQATPEPSPGLLLAAGLLILAGTTFLRSSRVLKSHSGQ